MTQSEVGSESKPREYLENPPARSDRSRGDRPPYDRELMFRVLVVQTLYTLSDDHTGYRIRDRPPFIYFAGLLLHDRPPAAKTTRPFREILLKAGD